MAPRRVRCHRARPAAKTVGRSRDLGVLNAGLHHRIALPAGETVRLEELPCLYPGWFPAPFRMLPCSAATRNNLGHSGAIGGARRPLEHPAGNTHTFILHNFLVIYITRD